MAVLELTYRLNVLDFDQNLTVLLPEPSNLKINETNDITDISFPVLYLLHGYTDDHTSWLRRSCVERYLTENGSKPLVIVCPSVQNSFYTDMKYGWDYYTYLTEEVPELLRRWIKVSDKPEETFIAGLSMGGYGTFKLALSHPERFAIAASFSGPVDFVLSGIEGGPAKDIRDYNVFGAKRSELTGTEHDLYKLLQDDIDAGKKLPKLYFSCGTLDERYQNNLAFKKRLEEMGVDFEYSETEGLAHEWEFWDQEILKLLNRLPIKSLEEYRR